MLEIVCMVAQLIWVVSRGFIGVCVQVRGWVRVLVGEEKDCIPGGDRESCVVPNVGI